MKRAIRHIISPIVILIFIVGFLPEFMCWAGWLTYLWLFDHHEDLKVDKELFQEFWGDYMSIVKQFFK